MGAEDREIRVVAFEVLIGVAVDHRQVVVVVLLADEAAGVLAEGPDLVLKGLGPAYQLGLVQHPVHHLHDLVAHLHTDADVHSAGGMGDVVLGAELLQPVRPTAARGHHRVLGIDLHIRLPVGDGDPLAHILFQNQVAALVAEIHLHTVFLEVLLNSQVDGLGLFRAHMADGAVHQLQARVDGPLADLLPLLLMLQTLDMGVRAKFQVDLIRVVDGLLGQIGANEIGQVSAHLIAQRQLPVRKSAGAGKTGGDVAVGLAVHALVGLSLGTAAVLHGPALLHHNNFLAASPFDHLQGRKNPGGTRSDDDDICFHSCLSFYSV